MKELSYLNKYLYKYRFRLLIGTLFVIISNIFAILPAQLVRYSLDLVIDALDAYPLFKDTRFELPFQQNFYKTVMMYGIIIVAMALIRGVFLYFMRQTIIVVSRLIEFDLKAEIYAHYQTLPLSFYRRNNTGDLMARISEDVGQVRMYLGPAIMYGLNLSVSVILTVIYMLAVDVKLTIYALLPLPVLSLTIYYVSTLMNKRSEEIQKSLSNLSTFVQESFAGIRVLKSFVREKESIEECKKLSDDYRNKSMSLARVESLFYPSMLMLIGLSTILTVVVGGIEVMNGHISVGNIAEFIIYVNMLTWPVTSLGWITSIIQQAEASQKRINEFLNTKSEIVSGKLTRKIEGAIRFDKVSLTYPDSGIKAINKISFEVKQGQSLAILGSTGSGKSTIANLICRMYDCSEGKVLIDGFPIQDYDLSHLRNQIGYVPQDVFLFSDTIRNNIAFGIAHHTEDEVKMAARDADLLQNIESFPQKFETMVGERGITLSGGQKQRVSIARAIVRKPTILILDDCLSAVDTKTENVILNSLKEIMKNRTTIIISHRVSSAKLADKIIVLEEGHIVESGTHEELLQKNGFYKELYETQLKREEVEK
ncbi:MAG: ABC transporter ATP-binding protein [Flammeovirgaceae bacterium]